MFSRQGTLIFAVALGLVAIQSGQATAAVELGSGGLNRGSVLVVPDRAAGGGKALMLYGRGSHRRQVESGALTAVRLRARALRCKGWPRLRLAFSGSRPRTRVIRSTRWRSYVFQVSGAPGRHSLVLRFVNPRRARRCGRAVAVDSLTFVAAERPRTPPPVPAPIPPQSANRVPTRTPPPPEPAPDPKVVYGDPGLGLASGQRFGFNDGGITHPVLPRDTFLAQLRDSRATLHRVNINWHGWEYTRGQYSSAFWNRPDRDYQDELDQGVRQIITLLGTPPWALTDKGRGSSSPDGAWHCDGTRTSTCIAPPDVRDPGIRDEWMKWVRAVVERYPQAAAIEVWNEPNIRWSWFQDQDPDLYALMVKYAGEAAHSVNPSMPVLVGSMGPYLGPSSTDLTDYAYMLYRVYQIAGPSSFDAIGWHAYACNRSSDAFYHDNVAMHLNVVRGVKEHFGDDARPLWLTETGGPTGSPQSGACASSFTEQQQREALTDVLSWAATEQAQRHDLPVVLVHSLFDRQADGTAGAGQFGVVKWWQDSSGQVHTAEKPGYAKVRCYFGGPC